MCLRFFLLSYKVSRITGCNRDLQSRLSSKRTTVISIVIPCYNEESRLDMQAFLTFLKSQERVQLLFVDDGSTDGTKDMLEQGVKHSAGRAKLVHSATNQGKGEAVRQGIRASLAEPGHYVGYWDADLATPLSDIIQFLEIIENLPEIRFVCGSRVQRLGATIARHWYRHYPGRLIATGISLVLGLPIYDTQCGAKLIERGLAEQIFAEPFSSRWLFDVELFARVISLVGKREAMQMIHEQPLSRWTDVGESKISVSYLPRIPVELVQIYARYHRQYKP
jgi:glycosyltransferase involved in cell wall biosynthesis